MLTAQDVKITESNIIDLKDYSEYSTVETVNCSYNVNIDGNDYTFYFILNVNFVDADKV
jgi:hypothetical protein